MACHSKRDEILIYDEDELILYNVNGTLVEINTTIKKIHGTQSNHLISLTYIVQDENIQYGRVSLSGSQFGLVIKNKNDQFRFVLYAMNLTHICCNSNYSFIITIKRKSKY
ncbi:unnamed protein product [Rotaria sp. Silwood1]|nr:unnamed protein product [Rotaria sp. Silwood1]CAF1303096.1 unnamed protein product [Rotaria sp. Silwood1]CAF1628839.1 unnamed protein product [Rotaria sp. Silwood1]CAF1631699.1 unnamed protein product [Rotaria sp. Silwood1]CAF3866065.1 unnamed protein product [Rotaria sp. Silwood1]